MSIVKRSLAWLIQPRVLPGWKNKKKYSSLSYERHRALLREAEKSLKSEAQEFSSFDEFTEANELTEERLTQMIAVHEKRFHNFGVISAFMIFVGVSSPIAFGLSAWLLLIPSAITPGVIALASAYNATLLKRRMLPTQLSFKSFVMSRD